MKVCFINSFYYPNSVGGAEATLKILAEGMVKRGHDATVVSLATDGVFRERDIAGVRSIYLPITNVCLPEGSQSRVIRSLFQIIDAYNPLMGRKVGRILDECTPDVLNTHNLKGLSVAVWREGFCRALPVVQTLHDYYLACPRSAMYRNSHNCAAQCLECRALFGARRRLSQKVGAVTAVSNRMITRLKNTGLFSSKTPVTIIRGNNREEWHGEPIRPVSPPPLILGFLGRLDELKGLESLIAVVNRFSKSQVILKIAGKGAEDYVQALRSQIRSDNVEFLGFTEPTAFFGAIHALVVPSVWEDPLPRVVHEAFGHGVPVIGAAIGGIPEMIEQGNNGYLFPAADQEALYGILSRLAADGIPGAMTANCLSAAAAYSYTRIMDQYEAVLTEVAASGQRRQSM